MARTSITHPLRIATLTIGAGAVGVTFAPGKKQLKAMTGEWHRDIDLDLLAIKAWGAQLLISLIEPFEFEELGIESLPDRAAAHGLEWLGLPIKDGDAPDHRFLASWQTLGPYLVRTISSGGRVVVHCKGGLGRAGTVASMLLIQSGTTASAEEAIAMVREARPGAIETFEQEEFLSSWLSGAQAGGNGYG